MKRDESISPPGKYQRFFEWFCAPAYFEELQGDLEENFERNLNTHGLKKANQQYKREVIRLFRPSVIKKLKKRPGQYWGKNNIAMFKNYSLVALRNISRHKLFASINIIGLAISMAVGLLAITFLQELYSYDRFHDKADRIYRVINTLYEENDTGFYASSSPVTGKRLKEEFTSAEKVVTIFRGYNGQVKKGDNEVAVKGILATPDFFDIFSFKLLQGNQENALEAPNSLVVSEKTAMALFGTTEVVGEIVQWDENQQMSITGVMANPPNESHIKFEAVGSFSTLEQLNRDNPRFISWTNMWNTHVYLLLAEGSSVESLQANLDQISEQENKRLRGGSIEMNPQPLSAIFPGKKLYNEIGARMDIRTVRSIVILAIVVLVSACFNYTNLSIARSLKRAKEVGVRKVIGAKPGQLITQFVVEAMIISVVALVFSFLLFQLAKPEFLALDENIQRYITLETATTTYFYFLLFALGIGLLAGIVPAFVLSRIKTLQVVKGGNTSQKGRKIGVRQVLIGLQFTLSMGFVMLVSLSYQQYKFALNFDLGFNTEQVLNVRLQGVDYQTLSNSLRQLPEITEISASNFVPSIGGLWMERAIMMENNDTTSIYYLQVNEKYLGNMGHELIAGRNFDDDISHNQVIVNEKFLEQIQMSAQEAINQPIRVMGITKNIVGVVKDFYFGQLDLAIEPFVFMNDPTEFSMLNLKVSSANMVETMKSIDMKWQELSPSLPLRATFYEDDIAQSYHELATVLKILGSLAFIAIVISLLGLLGMAIYSCELRLKELTIRKVLGAQPKDLLRLLSSQFVVLFVIALGLSIPATIYAFDTLIASEMLHVINIGIVELGSGALAVLVLAIITIGSQTVRTIRYNPVKYLRNE